jgi:hypothetical protein
MSVMTLLKRLAKGTAELRTVQVIDGDEREVTSLVAALRTAGCVVESVVKLGPDQWEVTARSTD